SPGSRIERVKAVWVNLGIERFEYRTAYDADVQPYVHGIGVETVEVSVPPEVRHLAILLRAALQRQGEILHKMGLVSTPDINRRDLLMLGERLRREMAAIRRRGESGGANLWAGVTAHAVAMKGTHALELIESQGVESLRQFLDKQAAGPKGRPTPSSRGFLRDPDVVRVVEELRGMSLEHPKVAKVLELVQAELDRNPSSRVIVFAQYRQTAELLVAELARNSDGRVRAARFVGQASHGRDEGLSQKEQTALLDRFRSGEINCLVATSVAEEGLDIPSTDLVIFYEPVPDVVRTIQRRGRTGRARAGRVVVLVATGTRDVALDKSARGKERRMHEMLERVQEEAAHGPLPPPPTPPPVQSRLDEFG
ncbi:MAG: hypothetical protein L3J96_00300, partial [Thermoplasmata archaeon]|nr:hypothetical protein [Thermoplasmata archaeon]